MNIIIWHFLQVGMIPYIHEDMHLGHMAERLRRGFYGEVDWAVIEVSDMEEGENECKAFLTSAGGIVTTIVRLAKKIIPLIALIYII